MVIYWVRYWYKETELGGAHWHQIKDPDFRVAGIGVAKTAVAPGSSSTSTVASSTDLWPRPPAQPLDAAAQLEPASEEAIEELLDLEHARRDGVAAGQHRRAQRTGSRTTERGFCQVGRGRPARAAPAPRAGAGP